MPFQTHAKRYAPGGRGHAIIRLIGNVSHTAHNQNTHVKGLYTMYNSHNKRQYWSVRINH